MIEILIPNARRRLTLSPPMSFGEYQDLVGGYVECVTLYLDTATEKRKTFHVLLNEDGMQLGLPVNKLATARFERDILMPPQGALGVWIVLSGPDLLD